MSYAALEFISLENIGQEDYCVKLYRTVRKELYQLFELKIIDAWSGRVVRNKYDAEEEILFFDFDKLTNSTFPFVYFCIQLNHKKNQEVIRNLFFNQGFEEVLEKEMVKFLGNNKH